ncbi:hypothetical protein J437_LFUL019195 [Ladona fulva]|uniref:Reverse transcriptase RNase H-like domain-containing protein n=1 Tax=Ladona fulva TaxID=123851 RepID=A0A8K0KTP7_LADFU|nr:hypothetical protein J437_LFUL019195 [Ladona fulva]
MMGAGLTLRKEKDEEEHVAAYISHQHSDADHSNELEHLAVVWAIEKLRCYIFGHPFTVVTNNSAVVWLQGKEEVGGKLGR